MHYACALFIHRLISRYKFVIIHVLIAQGTHVLPLEKYHNEHQAICGSLVRERAFNGGGGGGGGGVGGGGVTACLRFC